MRKLFFGALLGLAGIAVGSAAVMGACRRWYRRVDLPPNELARLSRAGVWTFEVIGYVGISIVAGCFLVFAKDWFVAFAYRPRVKSGDDELAKDEEAYSSRGD